MRRKFVIIFIFITACTTPFAFGQQTPAKKDSTKIYRSIEEFSKKRKLYKRIYSVFFIPVASTAVPAVITKTLKKKKKKSSPVYEGKIIRYINITTLNPFGYSLSDADAVPDHLLYKAGNSLHIRTRLLTIRDLLLIRKNKPFDSLLVKESERLIRAQSYVHDVAFTIVQTGVNSDSVDIFIRVLDAWSIVPNGAISMTSFSVSLEEKNFSGLGHDLQGNFSSNINTGKNTLNTNYFIPNIDHTYISSTLHYQKDENNNSIKYLNIDRPFYSPFAKWAAGIYASQQFSHGQIKGANGVYQPQDFKSNGQDYWAGYAYKLFNGNTENARVTNLITAGRFMRTRYIEGPPEIYDTLHLYSGNDFYLASIGISTRKYVQDKYVFNYGLTEDVPIGMVYSLTGGYNVKNNSGQLYLGARASFGNYHDWGYLSTNFQYGTYLEAYHSVQGVFSAGINYYTELLEAGDIKFRQFIKPQYTIGINRLANESLGINDGNGIVGFNSPTLTGSQKLLLTFQTQLYLPWNIIGFHFGPYLIYSLGMLGDKTSGFKSSRVYSQFGFGLLIKNEFLVFNSFQISIAFYPAIPGIGNNVLRINPEKSGDFGFQNFEIGKPAVAAYQ